MESQTSVSDLNPGTRVGKVWLLDVSTESQALRCR